MGDTMVVPPAVSGGAMLFARNSHREGSEAQVIEIHPRRHAAPGALVHATCLSLPQVYETAAVLLCRPYWMWGADMGVNEHGLAIGNEAVLSRLRPAADALPALSGMDLVRLGLERARTAESAVTIITGLIERHGQGSDDGHTRPRHRDSSFMIADPREAFVLEVAGRHWVLERVTGQRRLSHAYSIGQRFERISPDARAFAVEQGWHKGDAPFDFARAFTGPGARRPAPLGTNVADLAAMMAILRKPDPGSWRAQVTMSLAASLDRHLPEIWATGGSAPATALFRPFFIEAGMPVAEPAPTDRSDAACLWWRQERLHRAVMRDIGTRLPLYSPARDALETALLAEIARARASAADRPAAQRRTLLTQVSRATWEVAEDALARWTRIVEDGPVNRRPGPLHRHHWRRLDRRAQTQAK